MMFDGWMSGGGMWWPMVLGWVFWLVTIVVVVALVSKRLGAGAGGNVRPQAESAEAILKARYARGEIDREDYQQRLADLRR